MLFAILKINGKPTEKFKWVFPSGSKFGENRNIKEAENNKTLRSAGIKFLRSLFWILYEEIFPFSFDGARTFRVYFKPRNESFRFRVESKPREMEAELHEKKKQEKKFSFVDQTYDSFCSLDSILDKFNCTHFFKVLKKKKKNRLSNREGKKKNKIK